MENKPTFNREMLLPILLGVLSLLGIGVVFLFGRSIKSRTVPPVYFTETPFKFVYLGTEPGLSTLTPENTPTLELTETPEPIIELDTPTSRVNPTQNIVRSPTASPTIYAVLSKFDDTYYEILYSGDWAVQSILDTYQTTLHLSTKIGNSASFTFVGQQVYISYQAGPSLGSITVNLDGLIFEVSESNDTTQLKEWRSAILVRGTHTLVITHLSGGSVNLDSITIPDLSTPTPTPTATATP